MNIFQFTENNEKPSLAKDDFLFKKFEEAKKQIESINFSFV